VGGSATLFRTVRLFDHRHLAGNKKQAADYLVTFYVRRSLRIFPLCYGYLALNYLLVRLTGASSEGYAFYLLYLQNHHIGAALATGLPLPGVVGHTWSLAVEEQFYLIWPLVVFSAASACWLRCVWFVSASRRLPAG
jgi:peptidoglycan/LPS O-acetylase OafA/YrhL